MKGQAYLFSASVLFYNASFGSRHAIDCHIWFHSPLQAQQGHFPRLVIWLNRLNSLLQKIYVRLCCSFTRAVFTCRWKRNVKLCILISMKKGELHPSSNLSLSFFLLSLSPPPEFSFFDPSEPQCREVLLDPSTTIPELFAVLRQWVPQVQKNIDLIGNEVMPSSIFHCPCASALLNYITLVQTLLCPYS